MEDQLREQCRQGVRRVLAQRGWELVQDEATFVEEVLAEVRVRLRNSSRSLEKVIEDATVNRYGHLWHAACGAEGTLRQRRAFIELDRYLYRIALYRARRDRHIAEESAQEALIAVWQHLDQVRDPGSFARWAGAIVSNQVRVKLRQRVRRIEKGKDEEVVWEVREITETDLRVRGGIEGGGAGMQGIGDQPALSAAQGSKMTGEMRTRIEAAIRRCLRSKQQQAVIIGLFLDGKGFKEVADALGKKLENVYVLKSRALARLRKCQEFLRVLEDLL